MAYSRTRKQNDQLCKSGGEMTRPTDQCRNDSVAWSSPLVRLLARTTAVAATFVAFCVLMTCRVGWLCVQGFVSDPDQPVPFFCDIVLHYVVFNAVFELTCAGILILFLLLMALNARPQLFIAFIAVCVFATTLLACVTCVSLVTVVFPLVDRGL